MFIIACGALLATGLILNLHDRRMLALTLVVGASFFAPVPATHLGFYLFCFSADILVAVFALSLRTKAGVAIAELCVLLAIAHAMGYALNGNPPLSPYRIIVKLLEVSQLVVCVAFSPKLAPILWNRNATTS